jgi:hypothetical protein
MAFFAQYAFREQRVLTPTDADATAFLNAAGITDPTISSAINSLVIDLKGYGIWSKMTAIYPFVGGTATTHKYNLKNPADTDAAFRLTFSGGVTHATDGVVGNGSNGYYNTHIVADTDTEQDSVSYCLYIQNNTAENKNDIGFLRSTPFIGAQINVRTGANTFRARVNSDDSVLDVSNTDSRGFFQASRTSSTNIYTQKNDNIPTTFTETSRTPPNWEIYGLCFNLNNVADFFSTKKQSYASIGDGLNTTDLDNHYTAVQAFQTTLGRNQ